MSAHSRSTILRTGRLLTASLSVTNSALPAKPPQPSCRIRARIWRSVLSRHAACASLMICSLPHLSQMIRRNLFAVGPPVPRRERPKTHGGPCRTAAKRAPQRFGGGSDNSA